MKKNDFVLPLFLKQEIVQIGQVLLVTFSINRVPRF